jgi:hypothetical protein
MKRIAKTIAMLAPVYLLGAAYPNAKAEVKAEKDPPEASDALEARPDQEPLEKASFIEKMSWRMEDWERRIAGYQARIEREALEVEEETGEQLNNAWRAAQTQWHALLGASSQTWEQTKAAFEQAIADLEQVWEQVTTEKPAK